MGLSDGSMSPAFKSSESCWLVIYFVSCCVAVLAVLVFCYSCCLGHSAQYISWKRDLKDSQEVQSVLHQSMGQTVELELCPLDRKWYTSHKFLGPGVCYEVGT